LSIFLQPLDCRSARKHAVKTRGIPRGLRASHNARLPPKIIVGANPESVGKSVDERGVIGALLEGVELATTTRPAGKWRWLIHRLGLISIGAATMRTITLVHDRIRKVQHSSLEKCLRACAHIFEIVAELSRPSSIASGWPYANSSRATIPINRIARRRP